MEQFEALEPTSGVFGSDKVHRLPVRVYYEDTDFSGIVYHARYLHFFERGRTDSLRCMGIHHSELAALDRPLAFAVRRMNVEFVSAAKVDDALIVETIYRPSKGARLMIDQTLTRDGAVIATAEVEAVCLGPGSRAVRPPKDLVARWDQYINVYQSSGQA